MGLSTSGRMDDLPAEATFAPCGLTRTYQVYGVHVRSQILLSLIEATGHAAPDVELVVGSPEFFATVLQGASLVEIEGSWYSIAYLADGSTYVRCSAAESAYYVARHIICGKSARPVRGGEGHLRVPSYSTGSVTEPRALASGCPRR